MRERVRREDGVALISAVAFMVVLLALGFALLSFTNTQTHATAHEQWNEQAYAVAEAALNAQIFELSTDWPGTRANAYPSHCDATNGATTAGCPSPSGLSAAYPTTGPSVCPTSTPKDTWSSSSTTSNGWTTYVRSDGGTSPTSPGSPFFTSGVASNALYDTGDHRLWVRAVGVFDCHMMVVVSKVTAQFSPLQLPTGAIEANGFATANNGNKIIVDTIGTYAQPTAFIGTPGGASGQPGGVSMRCTNLTSSQCKSYRSTPSPGQVYPDTTTVPASPTQTLTSTQLNYLRMAAQANGTYFGVVGGVPQCPTSLSQLTGAPVFIEGPCNMYFKTNGSANSDTSPGVLVLNNGTLTLDGGATFFGVIYAANAQNAAGTPCDPHNTDVIHIEGSAEVQGALIVDGAGTICFGESGGNNGTVTNYVYDDRGFSSVIGYFGAAATPDSFRVLPAGQ